MKTRLIIYALAALTLANPAWAKGVKKPKFLTEATVAKLEACADRIATNAETARLLWKACRTETNCATLARFELETATPEFTACNKLNEASDGLLIPAELDARVAAIAPKVNAAQEVERAVLIEFNAWVNRKNAEAEAK